MASPSTNERVYIHPTDLDYQPSSSTNPHIRVVPAADPQNKYSNDCLVFGKEGLKNFPIVRHQGWWYELYCNRQTNRAFLGPFCSEVHATDTEVEPIKGSTEDQVEEETEDNEPSTGKGLHHTSVAINPTGPGSPHREIREPWAPLVTPTRQYSTSTLTSTKQQTSMGSTTTAITTTSTHTGPPALAAAPAAPIAPAAPAAPAAAPAGGAAQPGV